MRNSHFILHSAFRILHSLSPWYNDTPMNSLWRQLAIATNWPVLVAVATLTSIGLISIYAHDADNAVKQMVFAVAGIVLLIAMQTINYQIFARYAWTFYILSLLPIAYTVLGALLGNGQNGNNPLPLVYNVNGAYAWLKFGSGSFAFGLQPAELTKISFIMVMAHYLRYRSNYRNFLGLMAPFLLAAVPLGLILKQPDLGTALTFIAPLFAMVYVAGSKMRHLFAIVGMGVVLMPLLWLSGTDAPVFRHLPTIVKEYQRQRVYGMFSRSAEVNYQQQLAQLAMGTGGWTGKGFGQIPIGRRVPEAHDDMIFAIIGEQFGLIGSAIVLTAYIVLFAAGVEISSATREPFGKLAAVGIVSLLAGQAFINLMVVTRLMPVTGITLPFVSYGGSSLLASFIAVALLLNIGQNRPVIMAKDSFEYD